ncbi:cytochrome P450 [Aspergillus campestris IBT 28561]|uniref:Cytochrome P450 n=1 Tax=Aspergillus campestris (strain IBT 28561) TaxID=1392248 RepID=A0A2I1CTK2_ASPC2|nr:cytochrome P450 [Aspergillus campestris IBT 28561]PKY00944.1 cytochrome P450 [Aspergillus campestris IBT 28561]
MAKDDPDSPGLVSGLVKDTSRSSLYLLSLCACLFLGGLYLRKAANKPLPPGPCPLPIIGNIHQLLSKPLPDALSEWHQKYGPLVRFQSGNRLMISIASDDVCQDLMVRKGPLYNSRPDIVVAEEVESLQVMIDFLSSDDFSASFRRYGASVTNALGYGRRLTHDDEAEFHEAEQLAYRLVDVIVADFHFALVEIFPILDYILGFLAPWKAFGKKYYTEATSFYSRNLLKAQSTSSWNWVKHSLTRPQAKNMSTDGLSMLFGTALQAAVETIPSILRVFVKAMLLHPESLAKAQAEIDQVVGSDRLPSFSDKPSLPYINGIVNECCRWQAVLALGFPHSTTDDDEYCGYRIPKGTMLFANAWAIGFDEGIYQNARDFLPERWLENPELPNSAAFGYGPRVCPGKFIGMDSLFINIARMLWGYEFAHGERKVTLWDIDHAFTSSPRDFDAKLSIRSVKHRETLEHAQSVTETDVDGILAKIGEDFRA